MHSIFQPAAFQHAWLGMRSLGRDLPSLRTLLASQLLQLITLPTLRWGILAIGACSSAPAFGEVATWIAVLLGHFCAALPRPTRRPPPRRIACRNCCQNYDEKRRPQIVKSPIEHHRDTVYRDHGIAHSPLLGVSPVTQRSKQRHRTDRRTLAKHHAHEEAYRLTRPGRYAACAFLGWMMCASVVMCMCVLHEARICRRKGRNLCTRRLRSARPQSRG